MVNPLIARINKHNYDLFPLIGIMAGVCVGATGFAGYCVVKKPDVSFARRSNPYPWQRVDSSKPVRLMYTSEKWEHSVTPAVDRLRKEIGS